MKLNFTMSELMHSDTADREGINNIPYNPIVLDNLLVLITDCLQPLRNYIGKPMVITSGYRSPVINQLVGGAQKSQHLWGNAADFIVKGLTIDETIDKVKASGVEFDQLIHEGNWVHISYNKGRNRKQYLKV